MFLHDYLLACDISTVRRKNKDRIIFKISYAEMVKTRDMIYFTRMTWSTTIVNHAPRYF